MPNSRKPKLPGFGGPKRGATRTVKTPALKLSNPTKPKVPLSPEQTERLNLIERLETEKAALEEQLAKIPLKSPIPDSPIPDSHIPDSPTNGSFQLLDRIKSLGEKIQKIKIEKSPLLLSNDWSININDPRIFFKKKSIKQILTNRNSLRTKIGINPDLNHSYNFKELSELYNKFKKIRNSSNNKNVYTDDFLLNTKSDWNWSNIQNIKMLPIIKKKKLALLIEGRDKQRRRLVQPYEGNQNLQKTTLIQIYNDYNEILSKYNIPLPHLSYSESSSITPPPPESPRSESEPESPPPKSYPSSFTSLLDPKIKDTWSNLKHTLEILSKPNISRNPTNWADFDIPIFINQVKQIATYALEKNKK